MSSPQRILKNLTALFTANAIAIVSQLLLPPVFIYRYGTALYGQWLALSVAVAYLGTLNFGVQTFVNQDLTVRYNRGELGDLHVQQSTALRLLIGIVLGGAIVSTIVFFLPVTRLLKLSIAREDAAWALFFLALQILVNILFTYFSGTFMVVGRAHHGTHWANLQRLLLVLATAAGAWFRISFHALALLQLVACILCGIVLLMDLHRTAPEIYPSLRYWDGSAVTKILRPSGYFALILTSTFLSYQLPVLILQRMVGPVVVVAFTVMRTIFSMSRQVLNALTQSMGPEITRLFGANDWPGLALLYNFSERLVFALVPVVNIGVLALSPFLLHVWLHNPGLFSIAPYVVCAAVSIVTCAKEHKYQFQFSTNTHVELARMMFVSYLALVAIAIVAIKLEGGMLGFLWTWLGVEIYQLVYILRLNLRLFAPVERLTLTYMGRLAAVCTAALPLAGWMLTRTESASIWWQLGSGAGAMLLLLILVYPLFGMSGVLGRFSSRFGRKLDLASS